MQIGFRQYRHGTLQPKNLGLDYRVIEAWHTALPLTIRETFLTSVSFRPGARNRRGQSRRNFSNVRRETDDCPFPSVLRCAISQRSAVLEVHVLATDGLDARRHIQFSTFSVSDKVRDGALPPRLAISRRCFLLRFLAREFPPRPLSCLWFIALRSSGFS